MYTRPFTTNLAVGTRAIPYAVALSLVFISLGCSRSDDDNAKKTVALAGAGQSQADLDAVLAKIGDTEITVGEFQDRINRQSPYIRARYTSKEQKLEFLDSLIRFEVLAKEALRRGFDKDPDVIRTMKQVMIQKLMKDQFETKLSPDSIKEDDMRAYFKEHRNDYNKPEEVRVSAIIVKGKAKGKSVAEQAKGEAGKTNKGFRDLVSKHSTDEKTRLRGGDLRYFALDSKEIPEAVKKAAFALGRTGQVAGPVAAKGRFYIIKQTGKRKAISKTFEKVKRQIQNRLYRDKRTKAQKSFIDGLRGSAKIKIFDDKLRKVKIDTSARSSVDDGHGHGAQSDQEAAPPAPTMPTMPNENKNLKPQAPDTP